MQRPAKILIVEDESIVAMSLRRHLERLGFIVTDIADNCEDALQMAADTPPDLIMMDIIIQGDRDGIETARALRAVQDVPIVFLTAHSDDSTLNRAKQTLPYGYLVKPFEERELKTTIELAIYRHEAQTIQRLQHNAITEATVGIAIADARQPGWPLVFSNPAFEKASHSESVAESRHSLMDICGNITDESGTRAIESLLKSGTSGRIATSTRNLRGQTYHFETIFTPVRDSAGKLTHYLAIQQDTTERTRAEKHTLRAQRLESIGTLAGGVAHDLNNALAPILLGSELLRMQYPESNDLLETIEGSARRGADMVKQLLTFAKGVEGERLLVQTQHLLKEMEKIIMSTFPKNVDLRTNYGSNLDPILGDSTQLHQVLLNLCVNARDAMPGGGTLTLESDNLTIDETFISTAPEAKVGRYVVWRITDTGSGIPADILDHIFEPFFTTKDSDKGTGLGLSTLLGIVKSHGGFVRVYSVPGRGTTFTVYLPSASQAHEAVSSMQPAACGFRGDGEMVLVVDDDIPVLKTARNVLTSLNFKVITASDGTDALIQVANKRTEIRAIITDLHMPHMDGLSFVKAMKHMIPDAGIIVASGRMDEKERTEFRHLGVSSMLDKPFTQETLVKALKLALGK